MSLGMLGVLAARALLYVRTLSRGQVLTSVSGGQARRRSAQQKPLQGTRVQLPGMSCTSRDTLHEPMRRRDQEILFLQWSKHK